MVAAAERVQPSDRVERVLVDGVDVIDVVLNAARRRLPLGHERRQEAEVLHLLEARGVGLVAPVADDLHETATGVGIGAQRLAPGGRQLSEHLQRPQRQGDVESDRHLEDAEHLRRLLLEHRAILPLEGSLAHDEAVINSASVERRNGLAGAAWLVARGRPLEQPLGLVANQLGVRVVLVHQRLDRRVHRRANDATPVPRVGAEHRRDRLLQREAQVIHAAPGRGVHGDPDAQQPLGGVDECLRQTPGHHPFGQELLGIAGAEAGRRRPPADAEIAHAARTVLQIGLEEKDRVAEPAVARRLLGPQPGHEVLGGRLRHPLAERFQEAAPQILVPGQEARVEEGGGRRQIAGRQRQRLVVRPHGMPGVDLGVPQRIEDRLGQRLDLRPRRLRAQDQEVEIGIGSQLTAAEAPGREHRHRGLALRHLSAGRLDDDRVDGAGKRSRHLDPVSAGAHRRGGAFAGLRKCPDDIQRHRDQTLPESDGLI